MGLVLCGITEDKQQLALSWLVENSCHGGVTILPYVPHEELPALYCGAVALVFPSLFEGFGLPVIEAMACGCPVVCSREGSLPEVAGPAAAFVDAKNPDDIARTILSLNADPTRGESLRTAGLRHAEVFDWDRTTLCVLEVLREALKSNHHVDTAQRDEKQVAS
jgi:glycosyltransferase involved in cell wall biosynthesis